MLLKAKVDIDFPRENYTPGFVNHLKRFAAFLIVAGLAILPEIIFRVAKFDNKWADLATKMVTGIFLAGMMVFGPYDWLVSVFTDDEGDDKVYDVDNRSS